MLSFVWHAVSSKFSCQGKISLINCRINHLQKEFCRFRLRENEALLYINFVRLGIISCNNYVWRMPVTFFRVGHFDACHEMVWYPLSFFICNITKAVTFKRRYTCFQSFVASGGKKSQLSYSVVCYFLLLNEIFRKINVVFISTWLLIVVTSILSLSDKP